MIDEMDMGEVLEEWLQPIKLKAITVTKDDFVKTKTPTITSIKAVVQVATPKNVFAEDLDWSQRHILVHSKALIDNRQIIEYDNQDFKVVVQSNWTDYGYYETVAQATNEALIS